MAAFRESLGERSKRFLSARSWSIFADTSETSESTGDASNSNPTASAYAKRRIQVRKAQRTHRDRKAKYVEALEFEIVSLRRQNAVEMQRLEDDNARLRLILARHGISAAGPGAAPSHALVSLARNADGSEPRLQVRIPNEALPPSSGREPVESLQEAAAGRASPESHPSGEASLGGALPAVTGSSDLDLVTYGVNFVLSLEHPCMQHAHLLTPEHDEQGHMLLASTSLLAHTATSPQGVVAGQADGWQYPSSQLERLLRLSRQVNDTYDSLTPVEVWQQITTSPRAERVRSGGVELLDRLRSALAQVVDCRGFGAVINCDDFEKIMHRLLRGSRS